MEREAERLARCLTTEFNVDHTSPTNWDLRLTAGEQSRVAGFLEPLRGAEYFVVNMGGKAAEKDWGAANWEEMISRAIPMLERHSLVVVGAAEDRERGDQLIAARGGDGLNLCGGLTPRETYGVIKGARFFIGHDSGPLHLAAAAQVRCIGIFGDFNTPAKWHPVGEGHVIIHEMRGVAAISVERVLDALGCVLLASPRKAGDLQNA